jgi:adenylosuccinate synthase
VVGGQYGSEGKGKVALHIARKRAAAAVIRVGGPNSGHSGVDTNGRLWVFRQLPAASLAETPFIILPAGSLIDPHILTEEVLRVGLDPNRLLIDAHATVVTDRHRDAEDIEGLRGRIGSTGSGTGAALRERISRTSNHLLAADEPLLRRFLHSSTSELLRNLLNQGKRVVIEGTQGFGLSIWHGPAFPNATSRDTTAANFVAESGLAPHDVDEVVLTVRSFPIRVGGNSGPLENEIDWPTLAKEAKLPPNHVELTSATKRVRRVARFHSEIVRQAIVVNRPHQIVMNHLDYVDAGAASGALSSKGREFLTKVEQLIGARIDLVGISPSALIERHANKQLRRVADAS